MPVVFRARSKLCNHVCRGRASALQSASGFLPAAKACCTTNVFIKFDIDHIVKCIEDCYIEHDHTFSSTFFINEMGDVSDEDFDDQFQNNCKLIKSHPNITCSSEHDATACLLCPCAFPVNSLHFADLLKVEQNFLFNFNSKRPKESTY